MRNPVLILFATLLLAGVAMAGTITFASGDGIGETNNITGNNLLITPVDVWDQTGYSLWVSPWLSGKGGYSPPNTTPGGPPTAVFTEVINLPYGDNSGFLTVWADDTSDGWLYNSKHPDGLLLWTGPFAPAANCVTGSPSCTEGNGLTAILTNSMLAQGSNWFVMPTKQYWSDGFGIKYEGSVGSVPEPAGYLVLGGGLVLLGFWSKIKNRRERLKT